MVREYKLFLTKSVWLNQRRSRYPLNDAKHIVDLIQMKNVANYTLFECDHLKSRWKSSLIRYFKRMANTLLCTWVFTGQPLFCFICKLNIDKTKRWKSRTMTRTNKVGIADNVKLGTGKKMLETFLPWSWQMPSPGAL